MGTSGGARVVLECGNWLASQGHEVTVVYPRVRRFPGNLSMPAGLVSSVARAMVTKALDAARSLRAEDPWFPISGDVVAIPTLTPGLTATWERRIPDADVVIATSWETVPAVARLSPRKGMKVYFVQHYEIWDVWNRVECWDEVARRCPDPALWAIEMADIVPRQLHVRHLKNRIDATYRSKTHKVTTSVWLARVLKEKFGQEVGGTVRIGNNYSMFWPEQVEKTDGRLTILAPFRSVAWKGDDDAVDACRIIKAEEPQTDIVMFGRKTPPELPSWIKFHRNPDDDQLRRLYCQADIFLSPSWVEGYCLTPIEAMACGTPCVITDVGAVRQYAVADDTAVIVPPRSPAAMAHGCLRLLRSREERERMARRAFESVEHWKWDDTAADLEEILLRLLSNPRKTAAT